MSLSDLRWDDAAIKAYEQACVFAGFVQGYAEAAGRDFTSLTGTLDFSIYDHDRGLVSERLMRDEVPTPVLGAALVDLLNNPQRWHAAPPPRPLSPDAELFGREIPPAPEDEP